MTFYNDPCILYIDCIRDIAQGAEVGRRGCGERKEASTGSRQPQGHLVYNCTNQSVPAILQLYHHVYICAKISTFVTTFVNTLATHPSFNILLILCSQKEFGQWLLSQRDLWRLCQWAAFSGKQREDLGRKHNYHFSASIAISFGHFPLWRESWWIPASYCGCKFRAEVSFSQFGIFWARCLFLRWGAFYGGEKADERVVASYLAAKPPSLSSADTHNGLLRAAVGERRSLGGILCFSHHR